MQKTITVNGKKIKIVTRAKTSLGNFCGYRTKITCDDKTIEYHCNTLDIQEAMDSGFVRWVKEQ
jgi:hypothetical protein